MTDAFREAGVWDLLLRNLSVAEYTKPGDPFKFDFGYRVGDQLKLFHAVSLMTRVEQAITLASRYPAIAAGITRKTDTRPSLTAVIDDVQAREDVELALGSLQESQIELAKVSAMPVIAERARLDLRA